MVRDGTEPPAGGTKRGWRHLVHERDTDPYGYVALDGNYYWVPGTSRDGLKVLQYADRVKLYRGADAEGERAQGAVAGGVAVGPDHDRARHHVAVLRQDLVADAAGKRITFALQSKH